MKTLIIHPDDRSTDFLKPIYQNIPSTTVITKNVSQNKLKTAIKEYDQIIMLGHGSPFGLFNMSSIGHSLFAIGREHIDLLRDKKNIFIWCNADQFVRSHNLPGLSTGMFISEVDEASYCKVITEQSQVDASNNLFAEVLGNSLIKYNYNYDLIYNAVKDNYGVLYENNPVAEYNLDRWFLFEYEYNNIVS